MKPVDVWRYTLRSASALNARSGRTEHEGALVRIDDGYGCIHPWPELGDAAIGEQLARLAAGERTPLIDSALRCAAADGAARREGRSLFQNPVPESHWLALPGDEPETARAAGFDRVKLKLGRNLIEEANAARRWSDAGFRLRFDGNESLSLTTFFEFWYSLGSIRRNVEFVEDPVAWGPGWRLLREGMIPIAVDREVQRRFRPGDIAVLKPARSSWLPAGPDRFSVTSYMDHAVGQAWAAAEASRWNAGSEGGRMLSCGLLTHRCFEPDPFFERIRTEGPRLLAPEGTGLGFDDLLENLPWKRLS